MSQRRCFTSFMPTATKIMLASSPTIGHHSKLLHRVIPAYSRISKRVDHITAGKFNKASSDQTIEQPINKDKKSRGNLEEFIWNRNHLEDHYIDVQYKGFLVVL